MIQQGWREQYGRMRRSYRALVERAKTGPDSDIARDALFHFFQVPCSPLFSREGTPGDELRAQLAYLGDNSTHTTLTTQPRN